MWASPPCSVSALAAPPESTLLLTCLAGTGVGVLLIVLYLSVKSTRNQIIACFILTSISEIFFSSVVPAFIAGAFASFLSISTYFSTLGQLPTVIREKDGRYINMPIVCVSIVNSFIWTAYAILKHDVPLFATNLLAFIFMSTNLTFYLWTIGLVQTSQIQALITFFKIAFPEDDSQQASATLQ